jgi:phosphopantetheinyl transferase
MPLLFIEKLPEYMLATWEIAEGTDELESLIAPDELRKINESTHLEKRKLEKISQLLLLKSLGISPSELFYLPNGKPMLTSGLNISFSHSGNLSIAILANGKCGIDIEFPSDKIIRISSKFIHEQELPLMKDKTNIYWGWSIKEAVFKYFGERVLFKEHIHILEINEVDEKAIVFYKGFHGQGHFELKIYRIKNYYLAFVKTFTPS